MSLRLRQPQTVLQLRTESSKRLRESLAEQPDQYEELAADTDPPTLEEWAEQTFPGLVENFGMSFFHQLIDNPIIGNKIFKMRWWIWNFDASPHDLILADDPCIFTSGIDDPNLIVALPISPNKAFLATQSEKVASIIRRQDARVLIVRLNESSLAQARIRIYGRNTSPLRFIQNRFSMR